jgi:hypothetical protein
MVGFTAKSSVPQSKVHLTIQIVKSEVAIASLFCQTKQPKTFLLQVKTITKSPGIGIAESVKSCNLHQKGSFKA